VGLASEAGPSAGACAGVGERCEDRGAVNGCAAGMTGGVAAGREGATTSPAERREGAPSVASFA